MAPPDWKFHTGQGRTVRVKGDHTAAAGQAGKFLRPNLAPHLVPAAEDDALRALHAQGADGALRGGLAGSCTSRRPPHRHHPSIQLLRKQLQFLKSRQTA